MASQRWHVPSVRFRGVSSQNTGRWRATVCHSSKGLYAGTYGEEEEAAHARDRVLFKLGRQDEFQLPERMVPALLQELEGKTLEQVLEEMKVAGVTSKYRGVCWHKRMQKWEVRMSVGGTRKYCGVFHDEAEAGRAYDCALLCRHGSRVPHGKLNFPLADHTTGPVAINLEEVNAQLLAAEGEEEEEESADEESSSSSSEYNTEEDSEEDEVEPAPVRAPAPTTAPAARGKGPRSPAAGSKRPPATPPGAEPAAKRQQQQEQPCAEMRDGIQGTEEIEEAEEAEEADGAGEVAGPAGAAGVGAQPAGDDEELAPAAAAKLAQDLAAALRGKDSLGVCEVVMELQQRFLRRKEQYSAVLGPLQALAERASDESGDKDSALFLRMGWVQNVLALPGSSLADVGGRLVVVSNLLRRQA